MNQVCTSEREGQFCRTSSDCGGLKCVNQKCTSNLAGSGWLSFKLGAIHPFVGLTFAGGFDTFGYTGCCFDTFDGAFLFALHGGVFIGNHELKLEVAPVTYINDATEPGPVFEAMASYAYFIPLTTAGDVHVFYPLRFGVGVLGAWAPNTNGQAYFQMQADLLGVAIQLGHVICDFHLPSFRYAISTGHGVVGSQNQLLDWVFGVSWVAWIATIALFIAVLFLMVRK